MSSVTTDKNDPDLNKVGSGGQNKKYLVLSEEERAKGFVRPYRDSYIHKKCGTVTRMGVTLSETYARDPSFYGATFCVYCGNHFPLQDIHTGERMFYWELDGKGVGE